MMSSLRLELTGVENLDGVQLEHLQSLYLANNPALVHLDGLDGVHALEELVIFENPLLQRMPALPDLVFLRSVQVIGNDSLESIPPYHSVKELGEYAFGGDFTRSAPNLPPSVPDGVDFFVVGDNAALRAASAPPGFMNGGHVAVFDNPSLIQLELSGLIAADQLIIRDSSQLASVDVGSLALTKQLEVSGNPLLPLATFDGIAAASTRLAGTP